MKKLGNRGQRQLQVGLGVALSPMVEGKQAGGEGTQAWRGLGRVAWRWEPCRGLGEVLCSVPLVTSLNLQEMKDLIDLTPEMTSGSRGLQLCGLTSVSLPPSRVQQCL